jgi:hypothetical protein
MVVPPTGPLKPTPYRFSVLMDRAKQLATLAQQMEAMYLSLLERSDKEKYDLLTAGHHLAIVDQTVELQKRRVAEAIAAETVAAAQKSRTAYLEESYRERIEAGYNKYEESMLDAYRDIEGVKRTFARLEAEAAVSQAIISACGAEWPQVGAAFAAAATTGLIAAERVASSFAAADAERRAQENAFYASHERRVEEWRLQEGVAAKDGFIADQQIAAAKAHSQIVRQEESIANTQQSHAQAAVQFLATKTMNLEMYEWMRGVLSGVYSYFLHQATGVARLAQGQLAFERQEPMPNVIVADYWRAQSQASFGEEENQRERHGLTGAERLLRDLYTLDQYAFETNARKLNLVQSFSLSQLAPYEFEEFRRTGVLLFRTPMALFDRSFPGHYLRLIKRIRLSVVALIPPIRGIRATLTTSGISRVVVKAFDVFDTVTVHRQPEQVALTSPMNATGVFEMDVQAEMLLPFESMGVDTDWELQLPKPANPFDYRTLSDVLFTIEYTALQSADYQRQVIESLDRRISFERPFSLRGLFPDEWYKINNPANGDAPIQVKFVVEREDFPPNIQEGSLVVENVLLYFAPAGSPSFSYLDVELYHDSDGGEAATDERGVVSTREGRATQWRFAGRTPVGEWEVTLDLSNPTLAAALAGGELEDLLLVIGYAGETAHWPNGAR